MIAGTLIAYFSRAGENYVNGSIKNLPVGNAEVIARKIANQLAKRTGSDLFRIETAGSYPEDYYACTDVAKREKNDGTRPALANDIADLDAHDTVILVYPNWWGTMPMAVYTFLEAHDFAGKIILPVCTHEGSGLSGTEDDIRRTCPGATVGRGLAILGSKASASDSPIATLIGEVL